MAYKSLNHFVKELEASNELVRIKEFVDPNLEITDVYDRVIKTNGPALLFENTGTEFPLLINMMGSQKRIGMALGVDDLDDIATEIEVLMQKLMHPKGNIMEQLKMLPLLKQITSWMPKEISGKGPCQEVVMKKPDITKFPLQKCWPEDGGHFLTFPLIHTKDLHTGIRNIGLYRMQIFGPDLAAIHWQLHKVATQHFNAFKAAGKKMEVSVALGGDPVYTYAASAPMPENIDEYTLAGFLRKKKVELVKCITNDLHVPADADIILEGFVDPGEEFIVEGPFGDHTGYYSLADLYPKFHITCITHRKNAIYPATVVGIPPHEDGWIGKATERIFLAPIKMAIAPEIVDMELPVEGVFHNLTIAQIKKSYPGHAGKTVSALWGAGQMMLNKMLFIVDGEIDIHDHWKIARYISENTEPERDIQFGQGPIDVLDHATTQLALGGKMYIDATIKLPEEVDGKGITLQPELARIDTENIIQQCPDITGINDSLLDKSISLIIVSIKKTHKGHIQKCNEELFALPALKDIKMVIYLDPEIDINNITDVVWRFSNNVDPLRDSFIIKRENGASTSHIGIDGTRKTKEIDGFQRDWPNIVVMDDETIKKVDEKWTKLGLGSLIKSPSLKYRDQLLGTGAIAMKK